MSSEADSPSCTEAVGGAGKAESGAGGWPPAAPGVASGDAGAAAGTVTGPAVLTPVDGSMLSRSPQSMASCVYWQLRARPASSSGTGTCHTG